MIELCSDAGRMWGCAFAYDFGAADSEGDASGCMFVRLREDRRSVDVVAVMDECEGFDVAMCREMNKIARLLGKDFCEASARMQLCPMCCSSDMFVRSGAVHAFHLQEVSAGSTLHCSRHHYSTASECVRGKVTILGTDELPLVYPLRMHALQLPWKRVGHGGIIISSPPPHPSASESHHEPSSSFIPPVGSTIPINAHAGPSVSDASASSHTSSAEVPPTSALEHSHLPPSAAVTTCDQTSHGTFTDLSFFVLTGQVSAGDIISPCDLPDFMRHFSKCSSEDCCCDISLTDGTRVALRFSYTLGQYLPNPAFDNLPIAFISHLHIGDTTPPPPTAQLLSRFCAHDRVLVATGAINSVPKPKFLVFPGSSDSLQLCRITPELCQSDATAACCWSELQVCCSCMITHC
jgi:hypothetical protein